MPAGLAARRSLLAADMVGDVHHGVALGGLVPPPGVVAPVEEAHQGVSDNPCGVEVAHGGEFGHRAGQRGNQPGPGIGPGMVREGFRTALNGVVRLRSTIAIRYENSRIVLFATFSAGFKSPSSHSRRARNQVGFGPFTISGRHIGRHIAVGGLCAGQRSNPPQPLCGAVPNRRRPTDSALNRSDPMGHVDLGSEVLSKYDFQMSDRGFDRHACRRHRARERRPE